MHYQFVLLGAAAIIIGAVADRLKSPVNPPQVCNNEPATTTVDSTPICVHAADPSGGLGYCPDLSSKGWCDCGSAGTYPILDGASNPCGYDTLDGVGKVDLKSCTVVQTEVVTVTPV